LAEHLDEGLVGERDGEVRWRRSVEVAQRIA
jgi:hypothetical protein